MSGAGTTSGGPRGAVPFRVTAPLRTVAATWCRRSETARRGVCGTRGSSFFRDGRTGLARAGPAPCADTGDCSAMTDALSRAVGSGTDRTTQVSR
jgi:hypothetical protein